MADHLNGLNRLEQQYQAERRAWAEYHSCNAGSGCTSLRSHAEFEHAATSQMFKLLRKKYPRQAQTFKEMHSEWEAD